MYGTCCLLFFFSLNLSLPFCGFQSFLHFFLFSPIVFLSHLSHLLSSPFDYNKESMGISKSSLIHFMHSFIHPFVHSTNIHRALTQHQSLCWVLRTEKWTDSLCSQAELIHQGEKDMKSKTFLNTCRIWCAFKEGDEQGYRVISGEGS